MTQYIYTHTHSLVLYIYLRLFLWVYGKVDLYRENLSGKPVKLVAWG